jgi:gliding motility-associated-like protein
MILFSITNIMAQNLVDAASRYRVTAYQKGNDQIMSVSNEVGVVPPIALYIPNAFTPNGDGLNDTFGPVGEGITDYSMQIFNRWGNLIFESNDMNVQWDGNYHNEIAPTGTYVYKLSAKGPSTNGKSKKLIYESGSVTLVL